MGTMIKPRRKSIKTKEISASLPVFLKEKEAADCLTLSVKTLRNWRVAGGGPNFHKFNGAVRYSTDDLQEWAADRRYGSTSERLA